MIPTWKQKLLCTGCAAVLAAGLVPMAAWGGATEGSEPENATVFSEQTPMNDTLIDDEQGNEIEAGGDTQTSSTAPTSGDQNGDSGDEGDDNGQGDGGTGQDNGTGQGESGNDKGTNTPTEGDNQNQDGNTGEGNDQSNPAGTDDEGANQVGDDTNTGDTGTSNTTENTDENGAGTDDESDDNTDDPDQEVTYADVEVSAPSDTVMYPTFACGVIFDNAFQLNEAGDIFFSEHSISEYIESVTSSNPSVVEVAESDDGSVPYVFVAQKPGTATLTLKLKDKPAVSYEVQVKSFESIDLSKLKFTQKSLTLKVGESDWSIFFIEDYVNYEGLEDVEGLIVLGSSDYDVLNTYASDGSKVVAQRPGIVTVGLYFYNPETDEHTLTDTMTVTVVAPATIAGTTSSSDISGNILESNEQTDLMMKDEGVSLSVKIKSDSQLSAAQKKAIILVKDATGADKAIPVEIGLVDRYGSVLTENDNNYCYTVRLKLEGELASLDPATIQVYYLGEDGEPEYITSWVEDGYLYLVTDHFSPYVITGKTKAAPSTTTTPTTQASNKNVTASKKQTVTATAGETLPQAGDESTAVVPVVALSGAAAAAAIYLARRRTQE